MEKSSVHILLTVSFWVALKKKKKGLEQYEGE